MSDAPQFRSIPIEEAFRVAEDASRRRAEQETRSAERLNKTVRRWMKKYGGVHDTKLRCACGKTIKAHVTAPDVQIATRPPRGRIFLDVPTVARQRAEFCKGLKARYQCDDCGLLYSATVIQKKRGYTPPRP